MQNNTSFDKTRGPITMTCCFPPSSHFQINGEGPVGIWTGAIEYTTLPICRVNSWQLACVCKWECALESVCVCVYSIWAVASSVNLCTIECDTTWWWEEPGALKWYVVMTAPTLYSSPGYPFTFSYSASFYSSPFLLTCVFFPSHWFTPGDYGTHKSGTIISKDISLRHYWGNELEWVMNCIREMGKTQVP